MKILFNTLAILVIACFAITAGCEGSPASPPAHDSDITPGAMNGNGSGPARLPSRPATGVKDTSPCSWVTGTLPTAGDST